MIAICFHSVIDSALCKLRASQGIAGQQCGGLERSEEVVKPQRLLNALRNLQVPTK
jgi:hypothetical protein